MNKYSDPPCSSKDGRISYIDILRVLSMFGVLFMHLSSARLAMLDSKGWWFLALADSFFYTAVPVFFMISGALILSNSATADPAYLLRHRLPRLLVPLAIWSACTLALPFLAAWIHGEGLELGGYLRSLVSITAHEAAPPYWFLYYLIPLYLLSPVLKAAADGLTEKAWRYLGGLTLLVCVYQTCAALIPALRAFRIEIFERLFLFSGCATYFFFGVYLHRSKQTIPNLILYLVSLLDTLFITLGTWQRSTGGALDQTLQSYNLFFTLILSVNVFLLVKQNTWHIHKRIRRIFSWLAEHSFGVYLSHVPVILLLPSIGIDLCTGIGFLCSLVLVPAACLLISWTASRIRFLCWPLTGMRWQKKTAPRKDADQKGL